MIKLNNKNITYVALADSNNSIKAPKEIWYADSNNSVKLVYRRKDALIEGEDYEKYHWLDGDGSAYIDTEEYYRPYSDYFDFIAKDNKYPNRVFEKDEWIFGLYELNGENIVRVGTYIPAALRIATNIVYYSSTAPKWIDYCVNEGVNSNAIHTIHISKVTGDKYLFNYNGDTFSNKVTVKEFPNNFESTVTLKLFNAMGINTNVFNGAINKYIHYRDNEVKCNLIPCKLLKPVPKWLDANGIRRQVGECGMIDLVSGKFYGNVNSVGVFTVENYYERKEWLVGDGSAYISGITYNLWDNHLVSQVYNINKKYAQFVQSGINNSDKNISMTRNSIYLQIIFRELSQTNTTHIVDLNPNDFSGAIDLDYYISDSNFNVKVNGVTYTNASGVYATKSKWKSFNGLSIYSEMMSYISEITPSGIYVSNLIPCTLTMDLPASMDANNIARTKGTSGMWDLISDRFYGNVANSGTFKAVNLAEGVDYEVHQWLRAEINYVATLQRLPINSSSMSYKVKRLNGKNLHFFETDGYHYYYRSENFHLGIWDLNQKTLIYSNSSITDNELDFECSAENVSVNEVDIPIYGFPIKEVRFHAADSGGMETLTSSITVDGIERYIPVKLLRSIPAKYDANGRARQAGECGMYDTVNDVFYGNVAGSGTFSVSDDS